MNKKFLSAILFGALMVTSTGTFVSCKDYDDDIDAINKELTDVKSQIAALQAKVDAGKWITSVSSNAAGVTINLSDGSSLNITNGKDGKDGAQGAAGQDGKNGTVVTVNEEGYLCLDGVATEYKLTEEAPAAKPCVKLSEEGELMILEGDDYVGTGIKACGVTALNTNGVWTIKVGDDVITVPGSAALTSIAIQGSNTLVYNYGYFAKDVEWGFKGDLKTAEAGFYSRLSKDVEVLLNPAEADGTAFTYTFRNSVKAIEDLTFFGKARPSTAVLTRAASGNGVWTLPAEVTKHAATSITELRNELYLNFKQNDSKYYAMSLEAIDGLGNVSTRSDYEYKITLAQANDDEVGVANMNCLVGQEYYPVITGPVIDYVIRVKPGVSNQRKAEAFGIEIIDEKGFIAENESAVFNDIDFEVAYVTINGTAKSMYFTADFANEFVDSEEIRVVEGMKKPFDAVLARDVNGNPLEPKQFVMSHTYSLKEVYEGLDEDLQVIFDENFKSNSTWELFGGEAGDADDNYNSGNNNTDLKKNISWSYNAEKLELTVKFYVSESWEDNFQLNTAYQLNIAVKDEDNKTEVVKIELPFELEQPTLNINQINGEFAEWGDNFLYGYGEKKDGVYPAIKGRALYAYVKWTDDKSYTQLYDAFNAWKAKGSEADVKKDYQKFVDNAEYYDLWATRPIGAWLFDEASKTTPWTLNLTEALEYHSRYAVSNTYAWNEYITKAAKTSIVNPNTEKVVVEQSELAAPIEVCYKHYGVYPAFDEEKHNDGVINDHDFYLVFASWLKHSTLETVEDEYEAKRGTHTVFISNDDLNFTTPMGDAFYLFDGITASGKIDYRADLNSSFDEVREYPFTPISELATDANYKAVPTDGNGTEEEFDLDADLIDVADIDNYTVIDLKTGERTFDHSKFKAEDDKVQIYILPSAETRKSSGTATGFVDAIQGGMMIQLPNSVEVGEKVTVTLTLKDNYGYKNSFDIVVEQK